ncbi:hypothetical protein AAG912_01000 [Salmonella enterica]
MNNKLTDERVLQLLSQFEGAYKEASILQDDDFASECADIVRALREVLACRAALPVADVVAWSSPNEERTCDIRWRRHDVSPGPLYTAPQPLNDAERAEIQELRRNYLALRGEIEDVQSQLYDSESQANGYASAYEAEKWHYHGLAESEGERADRAEKRVAELESIATDYGVKFQKAQDALKHQALLHKSQMEAAEKRMSELENDEVRQRLANAEHQLHMAELAKCNLRASRKAQFRKRKASERRIAELEARTVILPEPISVLHRRDFTDAHREIYAYPEAEVNAALAAAGIKVKGD